MFSNAHLFLMGKKMRPGRGMSLAILTLGGGVEVFRAIKDTPAPTPEVKDFIQKFERTGQQFQTGPGGHHRLSPQHSDHYWGSHFLPYYYSHCIKSIKRRETEEESLNLIST